MTFQIYIPTYRRTTKQGAYNQLPESLRKKVTFVVDAKDAKELHEQGFSSSSEIVVHPKSINTIAKKRAWILETTEYRRIVMLDDDCLFYRRTYPPEKNGLPSLPKFKEGDLEELFRWLNKALRKYAHAGIPMRQMHQSKPDGVHEVSRQCYLLGYNVAMVRDLCELGRIETREDMDLTLQLLIQGYPNAMWNDFAVGQPGYNSAGGCSEQRVISKSNRDARKLARYFPGFVKVVDKDYEHSVKRQEVIVQWKKAYESGKQRRNN